MDRQKKTYEIAGKSVTLFPAVQAHRPLIVLNTHDGDGESVMGELGQIGGEEINLLVIGNLDWNQDMTPWPCPALLGGADEYLALLLSEILPKAIEDVRGRPARTCIAGYSLAGLFALYALYRCDVFDRAASISGSLWFPGFRKFVEERGIPGKTDKIYLSLGDKEKKTRHPLMKTVQEDTETIAAHYKQLGMDVTFELNPGNHFQDSDFRIARGIASI